MDKLPKKNNLSVALFDREETTVCDSVCSEPRSYKIENKENCGMMRRDHSKKVINLGKQTSHIFLGKTGNGTMMRQKSQRGLLIG
jgi:hypothetical protein